MRLAHLRTPFCVKAALLGTALLFPGTMAAQAVSLNEAIELAISTNPDIGIVASNREAVDEELSRRAVSTCRRSMWPPGSGGRVRTTARPGPAAAVDPPCT